MTAQEFNTKYKDHITPRFYGLAIEDRQVVEFLDDYFNRCIREKVEFQIQQIKLKFGYARVYTTLPQELNNLLENQIDMLTGKRKFKPVITN